MITNVVAHDPMTGISGRPGRTIAGVSALLFLAIYLAFFPATYSIEDECNILSLASSLAHGTVFLDRAGIQTGSDLPWLGHTISKYSPFHAALLVPAIVSSWRLAFLVTPGFVLLGAWIVVRMLERERLSSVWVLLYFINPGLLYYSRTVLAMVPSSVAALLGVSLLYREKPRPVVGALALGAAALLHIWLAPLALVTAACWWIERDRGSWRGAAALAAGAAPAVLSMALYNVATTGNPFINAYWLIGHQQNFTGEHWRGFGAYYALALLCVPPGGWVALTRRWAGSVAVPLAIAATVGLASVYYYRDGLKFGLAGWVPGLRFLLPASFLAVVPAARWWSHMARRIVPSGRIRSLVPIVATLLFGFGFAVLSAAHQDYLNAQRRAQAFIVSQVPAGARIEAAPGTLKFFAPVLGHWTVRRADNHGDDARRIEADSYVVTIGSPAEQVDPRWFGDRVVRSADAGSWIWQCRIAIGGPERRVGRLLDVEAR